MPQMGQTRSIGNVGPVSGLPKSGHVYAIYEYTPWLDGRPRQACVAEADARGLRMIPTKPAPELIRGAYRFSESMPSGSTPKDQAPTTILPFRRIGVRRG